MTVCREKVKPWPYRSIVKIIALKNSSKETRKNRGPLGRVRNCASRESMLHSRNRSIRSWSASRMSHISDGRGRWVET